MPLEHARVVLHAPRRARLPELELHRDAGAEPGDRHERDDRELRAREVHGCPRRIHRVDLTSSRGRNTGSCAGESFYPVPG